MRIESRHAAHCQEMPVRAPQAHTSLASRVGVGSSGSGIPASQLAGSTSMRRPLAIWIASLFLGGYGIYGLWTAVHAWHWATFLWSVVILVGSVAVYFRKRWSQYVVYLCSFTLIATWTYAVANVAISGAWPYHDYLRSAISLLPGLALVLVWLAPSIAIFMHFHSGTRELR